ncbi:hypothetical protein GCM10023238_19220 [Streptomyces heliomycini]
MLLRGRGGGNVLFFFQWVGFFYTPRGPAAWGGEEGLVVEGGVTLLGGDEVLQMSYLCGPGGGIEGKGGGNLAMGGELNIH